MRYTRPLVMLLIMAGLLIIPNSARVNVGPIHISGGGATLKSPHQDIQMNSEEVTIRLKKTGYEVEAVFHFFNTGKTATEWLGFPK